MSQRLALCICLLAITASAQSLPDGFQSETVANGLMTPVDLEHLPDGRLLVVEQFSSRVKVIDENGNVGTVGTVPEASAAGGRTGLGGIAIDPRWPSSPYIYVHYTVVGAPTIRIERISVSGDLSDATSTNLTLGDRYVVLDGLPDQNQAHNGSSLVFDTRGALLVSLGDDFDDCTAQSTSSLLGCILRLDVTRLPVGAGGPPPLSALVPFGNPFSGPDDVSRLVYAYGLRNPWRIALDTLTDDIAVGDVGSSRFEEVNVVTAPGQNFGWPFYEGTSIYGTCTSTPSGVFEAPAISLDHTQVPGPKSVLALDIYRNDSKSPYGFGPDYEGSLFYADYFSGEIKRLVREPSGNWGIAPPVAGQTSTGVWASGFFSVAAASRGEDGALYLALHGRGEIVRIKSGIPPRSLRVVSGGDQIADADRTLRDPIVVEITDRSGLPVAGVPVTFEDGSGTGQFGNATVTTGLDGRAAGHFLVGSAPSQVTVSEPTGATAAIPLVWRGLGAAHAYFEGRPYLFIAVAHSETSSPVLVVGEPTGFRPPVKTVFGPVLSVAAQPVPGMFLIDGMGIFGPPDGSVTEAGNPTFQRVYWDPPLLGGVSLSFQAFAIDHTRLPGDDGYLISNVVDVFLP